MLAFEITGPGFEGTEFLQCIQADIAQPGDLAAEFVDLLLSAFDIKRLVRRLVPGIFLLQRYFMLFCQTGSQSIQLQAQLACLHFTLVDLIDQLLPDLANLHTLFAPLCCLLA